MRAGRSVESGLMKGGTVVHEGAIQQKGGGARESLDRVGFESYNPYCRNLKHVFDDKKGKKQAAGELSGVFRHALQNTLPPPPP